PSHGTVKSLGKGRGDAAATEGVAAGPPGRARPGRQGAGDARGRHPPGHGARTRHGPGRGRLHRRLAGPFGRGGGARALRRRARRAGGRRLAHPRGPRLQPRLRPAHARRLRAVALARHPGGRAARALRRRMVRGLRRRRRPAQLHRRAPAGRPAGAAAARRHAGEREGPAHAPADDRPQAAPARRPGRRARVPPRRAGARRADRGRRVRPGGPRLTSGFSEEKPGCWRSRGISPVTRGRFGRVSAPAQPRLAWLDALRGLGAMAVVAEHMTPWFLPSVRPQWFHLGVYGIFVFFLVSGYIIPASLERHGDVRSFWISRLFRLYPLYLAVGLLVVALHWWVPVREAVERDWASVAGHATMLLDVV